MSRLKELYNNSIKQQLLKKLELSNPMSIPSLKKIVLNMGVKEAVSDSNVIEKVASELFAISGQKPIITRAKKSVATFKLREGAKIGCSVTLRKEMMYNFFDRLVNIALPRSKDFKGFNAKQFDGRGNFSIGIKEHIIFPEVDYDKVDKIRGLNINFITTANTDAEAKELLSAFNFPFIN